MKFKYNIKNNFYKMYGEANFLFFHKQKYLKGSYKTIKNYINTDIILTLASAILIIITYFKSEFKFLFIPILCCGVISLLLLLISISSYLKYKKDNHKGEIIIDENGITDISDITITFPWEKVELIGVTKDTLAIILDSPIVIILNPNEKIINEILKYKDVRVVRNK